MRYTLGLIFSLGATVFLSAQDYVYYQPIYQPVTLQPCIPSSSVATGTYYSSRGYETLITVWEVPAEYTLYIVGHNSSKRVDPSDRNTRRFKTVVTEAGRDYFYDFVLVHVDGQGRISQLKRRVNFVGGEKEINIPFSHFQSIQQTPSSSQPIPSSITHTSTKYQVPTTTAQPAAATQPSSTQQPVAEVAKSKGIEIKAPPGQRTEYDLAARLKLDGDFALIHSVPWISLVEKGKLVLTPPATENTTHHLRGSVTVSRPNADDIYVFELVIRATPN